LVQGELTRLIKIGRTGSDDMAVRLSSLQVGSPDKLAVLATVKTSGTVQDCTIERTLHNRLLPHRSHGEWFYAPDEVVRDLALIASEEASLEHTRVLGKMPKRARRLQLKGSDWFKVKRREQAVRLYGGAV